MSQSLDTFSEFAYTAFLSSKSYPPLQLLGLQAVVFLGTFAINKQLVVQLVEDAGSFHVERMEHFSDIAHFL